jgi:hypothetical protein
MPESTEAHELGDMEFVELGHLPDGMAREPLGSQRPPD